MAAGIRSSRRVVVCLQQQGVVADKLNWRNLDVHWMLNATPGLHEAAYARHVRALALLDEYGECLIDSRLVLTRRKM